MDECFNALFVRSGGEPPPGWRGIQQLGQRYCSIYTNVFQRVVTHTAIAKNFDSIQRLSTLANNVMYMFTDGQMVSDCYSEDLDL